MRSAVLASVEVALRDRMKVLLCHSYYPTGRGEDRSVYEEERELLQANGHDVIEYVRRNEELVGAAELPQRRRPVESARWARVSRTYRYAIRPDVLHATNTFPLISPSVCDVVIARGRRGAGAAELPAAVCELVPHARRPAVRGVHRPLYPLPAIKHRCYRDSARRAPSSPRCRSCHRTLGVWRNRVDAFFTVSRTSRDRSSSTRGCRPIASM